MTAFGKKVAPYCVPNCAPFQERGAEYQCAEGYATAPTTAVEDRIGSVCVSSIGEDGTDPAPVLVGCFAV